MSTEAQTGKNYFSAAAVIDYSQSTTIDFKGEHF